jgi:hypothetical protein
VADVKDQPADVKDAPAVVKDAPVAMKPSLSVFKNKGRLKRIIQAKIINNNALFKQQVPVMKKKPMPLRKKFMQQIADLVTSCATYVAACAWNSVFNHENSQMSAGKGYDFEHACDADPKTGYLGNPCSKKQLQQMWLQTTGWAVLMIIGMYYGMSLLQSASAKERRDGGVGNKIKAEVYDRYMDLITHAVGFIVAMAWQKSFHASIRTETVGDEVRL